jgi:hypothetical protein
MLWDIFPNMIESVPNDAVRALLKHDGHSITFGQELVFFRSASWK